MTDNKPENIFFFYGLLDAKYYNWT